MSDTGLYTPVPAYTGGEPNPLKGLADPYGRKTALRRAVQALYERGMLEKYGSQVEVARLLGVKPKRVYKLVAAMRRKR